MRKIILYVAFTIGIGTLAFAQEPTFCSTSEKMQEYKESLSQQERALYELQQQTYEQQIQQTIADHPEWKEKSHERGTIKYTIPVVFHILHEGGSENISNEQIYNAINHMNEDYQKSNSSWPNVVPYFLSIVADIQIEFILAKKDPNGNCTNGITRTYTSETNTGNGNSQIAAVKAVQGNWPGDKYLNIYVAKYIGGAAGYTMLPNGWLASSMGNGIFVLDNYVGSIGTSGSQGAHTLTHEVGHWLNLDHTWGGSNDPGVASNCGIDDGVSDTPNTIGWKTCTLSGSTCNHPGIPDNVENFMEYSYCSKMFTEGQRLRMWAALDISSTGRKSVVSAGNIASTGVNLSDILCKAAFISDNQRICLGKTVTFNDQSYNAATSWEWIFPGGTPSTSTDQNPTITYNTPGTYKVVLKASDGSSTDTETRTDYITVLGAGQSLPFIEGFEDYSTLSNSPWTVSNPGGNAAFKIAPTASYTGNKSIQLQNFGQPSDNIDEIISSPIDLTSVTSDEGVSLTFRMAYRKKTSQSNERLQVSISNDCGVTWSVRKTLSGSLLGSKTAGSSWTPSSKEDWVTVDMTNITSQYWVDNFMVKFTFQSGEGNNIFLDDINIFSGGPESDPLDVDQNEMIHSFNIYPNPAKNVANVTFSTGNSQKVEVSLVDMMGQDIQVNTIQTQEGKNTIQLNTENIDSGVYFIRLNIGGIQQTKRLIIR